MFLRIESITIYESNEFSITRENGAYVLDKKRHGYYKDWFGRSENTRYRVGDEVNMMWMTAGGRNYYDQDGDVVRASAIITSIDLNEDDAYREGNRSFRVEVSDAMVDDQLSFNKLLGALKQKQWSSFRVNLNSVSLDGENWISPTLFSAIVTDLSEAVDPYTPGFIEALADDVIPNVLFVIDSAACYLSTQTRLDHLQQK